MCVHSETETRPSFICNSTPQSMTSLRLPTSKVIDCGVKLHQGFEATPLPVGAKPKMFVHPLWKMPLLVIHPGRRNFYCWYIATDSPHANTVQRRKETYIPQMWWIELKYGFYLQNPAYFPRIYLWIFDKYSSTSFWWLSVYQQNVTAKSIKYYNPPSPPPRFCGYFVLSFFNHIVLTFWLVSMLFVPLTMYAFARWNVFLVVTIIGLSNKNDVIVQVGYFTVFSKKNTT